MVIHYHNKNLKGTAVAVVIYMTQRGFTKDEIRDKVIDVRYGKAAMTFLKSCTFINFFNDSE